MTAKDKSTFVSFSNRPNRTMNKFASQRWQWLALVLACLWLLEELRYWQLHQRLDHLWVRTVILNVVDDSSGAHLPCSIGGIPNHDVSSDYLPWVAVGGSTAETPSVTVASDTPLTVEVGSSGYQEQPLTISADTSGEVTVRLKKK
jgi:hypothetical protein